MTPLHLAHHTVSCCAGDGLAALRAALHDGTSGLRPYRIEGLGTDTWIGEVQGLDDAPLPAPLAGFDCRNNRLARRGLAADGFEDAIRSRISHHGPRRVGIVLGTSTSGILSTELAYRQRAREGGPLPSSLHYRGSHNTYSLADFVRTWLAIEGPAYVVSTACSSSAKAYAAAARLIHAGLIDAALVGGVDSLCFTTLHGFASLELTSPEPCRPYDAARSGISIGEAAAFAFLERTTNSLDSDAVLLLGCGESSDAYHMSSPHPEGLGARLAMEGALAHAGLGPADIDYINLHGTATPNNDAAEGHAVASLFGTRVPASSTKGVTGHTLGAAGALEISVSAVALAEGLLPGSVHTRTRDPSISIDYVLASRSAPLSRAMSNSFGFGGSNCSVIIGRAG
ncbi:beta-ketoacyl-[acyl-carrier-protein] synthase family protein [Zoogloea sp.]|uniref:beta-ketoacyl-[acyl-carrier-protein] synthase family protein n=1 Tax=Zoogloea sp. TaxID=49181 RepID=UPI002CE79087|nr:beta-ketoacyl-[acyl-carrier-protein] synthase family protein [Zoogloea sp.]